MSVVIVRSLTHPFSTAKKLHLLIALEWWIKINKLDWMGKVDFYIRVIWIIMDFMCSLRLSWAFYRKLLILVKYRGFLVTFTNYHGFCVILCEIFWFPWNIMNSMRIGDGESNCRWYRSHSNWSESNSLRDNKPVSEAAIQHVGSNNNLLSPSHSF